MEDDDNIEIRQALEGWLITSVGTPESRGGDMHVSLELRQGNRRKTVHLGFNECGWWLTDHADVDDRAVG